MTLKIPRNDTSTRSRVSYKQVSKLSNYLLSDQPIIHQSVVVIILESAEVFLLRRKIDLDTLREGAQIQAERYAKVLHVHWDTKVYNATLTGCGCKVDLCKLRHCTILNGEEKAEVLFRWTHSQFHWVMQTACHRALNCHGNISRMYVRWLWIY